MPKQKSREQDLKEFLDDVDSIEDLILFITKEQLDKSDIKQVQQDRAYFYSPELQVNIVSEDMLPENKPILLDKKKYFMKMMKPRDRDIEDPIN